MPGHVMSLPTPELLTPVFSMPLCMHRRVAKGLELLLELEHQNGEKATEFQQSGCRLCLSVSAWLVPQNVSDTMLFLRYPQPVLG